MAKPASARKRPQDEAPRSRISDDAVSNAIGRQLRAVYDEALNEPIPPKLSELVTRLSKNADKQRKR